MIVVANKAEENFLLDFQNAIEVHPQKKCFYVCFSELEIEKKSFLEIFIKALSDLPNSYMAQLYICHDKDVFILMEGFMQRQFLDFLKKVSEPLSISNIEQYFDIYEIGLHAQKIKKICIDKINILKSQEEVIDYDVGLRTAKALSYLDPDEVVNLSQRRAEHDVPVVMVVDDDKIAHNLIKNVLMNDCKLSYAHTGEEALIEYVESAPDVVFLDIGLPDINGHDVLECLFQIDPSGYVIMLSGRKDKANIVKSIQRGAHGFVGKPFTRQKIIEYVERSPFMARKKNIKKPPHSSVI